MRVCVCVCVKGSSKKFEDDDRLWGGYLWKEGKIFHSWRLRYFILTGDFRMRYYTESLSTFRGTVNMKRSNFQGVIIPDPPKKAKTNLNPDGSVGFPFNIKCKDRTWKFRARTGEERDAWVKFISRIIAYVTV